MKENMEEELTPKMLAMIAAEKAMIRDIGRGILRRDFITPEGPPTGKNPTLVKLDALYGGNAVEIAEKVAKEREKKHPGLQKEFDRATTLICYASNREGLERASFARAEYMHRFPDHYDIGDMGEALSKLEKIQKAKEEAAYHAEGKQVPPHSKSMKQFLLIQRNLFNCKNDLRSMITAYTRAIKAIEAISFTIPDEKRFADWQVQFLKESIERFNQELTDAAMSR